MMNSIQKWEDEDTPAYALTGVHTPSASGMSLQSSLPGLMIYFSLQYQQSPQINTEMKAE